MTTQSSPSSPLGDWCRVGAQKSADNEHRWHGQLLAALALSSALTTTWAAADAPPPLTNNPFELDPVTNEHTAQMTLARASALEYYEAGKYRLAEQKFIEALAEAKLGFDKADPHIASCQNNLAEFYRNTGQLKKAEQLYFEALDHLESLYGLKHWLYASTLHNLALMYESDEGTIQKAHETMERVVRLRLSLFGPESFLYADSMFALACIVKKLRSLKVRELEKNQKDQRSSTASGWWASGWWASSSSSNEKKEVEILGLQALQLMSKALAIIEGSESVQINVALYWLQEYASYLREFNRPKEAAACLSRALNYMAMGGESSGKEGTSSGQPDQKEALAKASALSDSLVDCLLEAGDLRGARDQMGQCLAARIQLFGESQLVVVQSMLRMARIEGKLGSKGEACRHAKNAVSLSREIVSGQALQSSKQVGSWFVSIPSKKEQGDAKRFLLKRIQALNSLASSLKQLASLKAAIQSDAKEVERLLIESESAYLDAHNLARDELDADHPVPSLVDEIAALLIETALQRIECLEILSEARRKLGDQEGAEAAAKEGEEMAARLLKK